MIEHDDNKERLELALEAAGLDLWENDLVTGEVPYKATKVFAELGYNTNESAAFVDDIFLIIHPDDLLHVQQAVANHLSGKSDQYRSEFRLRSKSGEWIWYANYGRIMDRDSQHPGKRFIGVTFNIHDRKRREDMLESMNRQLAEQNALLENMNTLLQTLATTDSLTGVANRRKLVEEGNNEFLRAQRFGQPLSLLFLDIDNFKLVNDSWGHPVGDQVICTIARTCSQAVRANLDTVARIGGEEFAILLPQTAFDSAMELAQRLCSVVAGLQINTGIPDLIKCTVSIGIASLAPGSSSFEQLMIEADKALYQAKESGRNCISCSRQGPA